MKTGVIPISLIEENAPKGEIKSKLNEIIEFLNALDIKPKPAPVPLPAEWSQSRPSVDNGYRPKNPDEPSGYWLDPTNFLIKREAVPQGEIEKWEIEHAVAS